MTREVSRNPEISGRLSGHQDEGQWGGVGWGGHRQGAAPPPALCQVSPNIYWIPFGDHPLKLERYRED